ncbi:hypothetical protein L2725_10940 [Shewanella corallii]|uniref:SMODS-associating 2TM beta-strand rich effector domain-containing protein n=1 Tax=Shewanella corallii TaxID=560080 RepID=A0ABT0N763_9GAMM|nr:hypothetical protein [Shewanella corallii]MCL2914283.1 hypothetical protein [Shewanella corallii]
MSPIEKITEPTFTNSSKGLLTLFCIGVAHTVVGVDLKTTEIAIPWLPTVDFPNADRLPYLYWGIVVFSMYRYTLHNIQEFKKVYFEAIGTFLNSQRGTRFIQNTIYGKQVSHQVRMSDSSSSEPSITIEQYKYTEDDWGEPHGTIAKDFKIEFDMNFTFKKFSYLPSHRVHVEDGILDDENGRAKWGLTNTLYDPEEQYKTYYSTGINNFFLNITYNCSIIRCFIKSAMRNKNLFDLSIPVFMNLALLVYCLTSAVIL